MVVVVRIVRPVTLRVYGTKRQYKAGDVIEVDQIQGTKLIRAGTALPTRQASKPRNINGRR